MSDYEAALQQWRSEVEKNLRHEHSWLALAGLFWLEEGENLVGSAPNSAVRLPERFPEKIGAFHLDGDQVSFRLNGDAPVKLNEKETLSGKHALKADISGEPDALYLEDLKMMVVVRDGKAAVRVWDPQHPRRGNFKGRKWYPPNSNFRVRADIRAYDPPKKVLVDDVLGFQQEGQIDAALVFKLDGRQHSLDAKYLDSGTYYVIFQDATAGKGSYPAGRYLVTDKVEGDKVMIDFNRAYNPPCAFTDFATCPLPRPENIMDITIEAGEQYPA